MIGRQLRQTSELKGTDETRYSFCMLCTLAVMRDLKCLQGGGGYCKVEESMCKSSGQLREKDIKKNAFLCQWDSMIILEGADSKMKWFTTLKTPGPASSDLSKKQLLGIVVTLDWSVSRRSFCNRISKTCLKSAPLHTWIRTKSKWDQSIVLHFTMVR